MFYVRIIYVSLSIVNYSMSVYFRYVYVLNFFDSKCEPVLLPLSNNGV